MRALNSPKARGLRLTARGVQRLMRPPYRDGFDSKVVSWALEVLRGGGLVTRRVKGSTCYMYQVVNGG